MDTAPPRKGARRGAEIPPDVRRALNLGLTASVNLVEFLAVDLHQLVPAVAAQIGLDPGHPALCATLERLPGLKSMARHWAIAEALRQAGSDDAAHRRLATHRSDFARQWAALQLGLQPEMALAERLAAIRPFAADPHFGVREIAWMAVRPAVAADLDRALALLTPWTAEADANLRRFASELTRPRGVWCMHIEALKDDPSPALPLLEALRADPSRYVQNSVANWLNDAAKSQPHWVRRLCERWRADGDGPATRYICRRGLRTLDKNEARAGTASAGVTKKTRK